MSLESISKSKENSDRAFGSEYTEMNSEELNLSQISAPDYLQSFNIDTDAVVDDANAPHYIINLNGDVGALSAAPAQNPSEASLVSNQSSVDVDGESSNISASYDNPPTPSARPFFLPTIRSRGRGRGRFHSVPLDEVMEQKIRTFEGRDCSQHVEQLLKLFPRFKRAYVNRIYTRNMLNYDLTYQSLKEENDRETQKYASVRLVQSPKASDSKRDPKTGPRLDLNSPHHAFLYMGLPLSRCPPHIANSLYRRVIIAPDGTVEPADEREQKFMDATGRATALLNSQPEPRRIPPPIMLMKPPTPTASPSNRPLRPPTTKEVEHPDLNVTTPESNTLNTVVTPVASTTTATSTPHPSGNRFFRTNRVCETEMKKRDYLNRELHQAAVSTPVTRMLPSSTVVKSETDSIEDTNQKSGDAVKYMAKVGVVSNAPKRKRSERRKRPAQQEVSEENVAASNGAVEAPVIPPEEPDDGLKISNEERRQLLSFFNEALIEELALMPGCSRKTAQILISLRPFNNTSELVNRLNETRHLSVNLIDSCKEILQMRSTVIRLLQRCERLTERVAVHAAKLLANDVSLPMDATGHFDSPIRSSDNAESEDYDPNKQNGLTQLLTQQPAILNPLCELKPYQLVGLNWLRLLHHEQVNGILADEMGLGKTIQAIAFLASLWENGDRGPHLIICPSSTQDNWQRELSAWCPHLKVLVYQGSAEQRKAIRLKVYESASQPDFNILLTSYAVGTSAIEDRALMKRVNFHYGIFDEAHMLKNMTSQRYRYLVNFRVQRRLLLTGTPLQNNLLELISLLSFVMPDMFMRSTDLLKRMFQIYAKPNNTRDQESTTGTSQVHSSFEEERLVQAKNLLQPFILRRLKSQVLDQLPPKTTEIIHVPMSSSQALHYKELVERLRSIRGASQTENGGNKLDLGEIEAENVAPDLESSDAPPVKKPRSDEPKDTNRTESPANMVCGLRKAANHQALLSGIAYNEETLREIAETLHSDPSHSAADPELIYQDLASMSDHQVHKVCQYYEVLSPYTLPIEYIISGSGKITWLQSEIPKLIADGHRMLIFSQFVIVLDILEEFLRSTDRRYLRLDGGSPVNERQTLVDRFNSSSIEIFLLSTRAGGLGINLTGADTVILHDIDFNPYNDRQAEDRCHRLGQKKPVRIIRLISKDTVEEGMLRIATDKLRLEQNVTGMAEDAVSIPDNEDDESELPPKNKAGRHKTNGTSNEPDEDDLSEPESTFKVLESWNQVSDSSLQSKGRASSMRMSRVSENDVRSLLADALKI